MFGYRCECGKRKEFNKICCSLDCPTHPRHFKNGHGMHMQRFSTDKYDNTGIPIHRASIAIQAKIRSNNYEE